MNKSWMIPGGEPNGGGMIGPAKTMKFISAEYYFIFNNIITLSSEASYWNYFQIRIASYAHAKSKFIIFEYRYLV